MTFNGICNSMRDLLNWIALSMKFSRQKYFFGISRFYKFSLSLIVLFCLWQGKLKEQNSKLFSKYKLWEQASKAAKSIKKQIVDALKPKKKSDKVFHCNEEKSVVFQEGKSLTYMQACPSSNEEEDLLWKLWAKILLSFDSELFSLTISRTSDNRYDIGKMPIPGTCCRLSFLVKLQAGSTTPTSNCLYNCIFLLHHL